MRRTLTLISVLALMMSMLAIPAAMATPDNHGTTGKVTLCHATHSTSNPYVVITIDPAAIFRQGHDGHHGAGQTFFDIDPTPGPGDRAEWDDIIPAFDYTYREGNQTVSGSYPGMHWGDGPLWNDDPDAAREHLLSRCFPEGEPPFVPEGNVSVEKTASTRFTRTHDWSIDKSVDPETLRLYLSGDDSTGTATWDVDVTYEGFEDGGYTVYGTIEVSNGGNTDARIDSVDDGLDGADVECEVDLAGGHVLEPGDAFECTYEVEVADGSAGTNTATASGDYLFSAVDPELDDEPFESTGSANYSFGTDPDDEVNACVTVTDTNAGFGLKYDSDDSTLCAVDFTEGMSESFTYSETFDRSDYPTRGDACVGDEIINEAEVVGDEEVVLDFATATLTIEVQCEVFAGETATGFGPEWRRTKGAPNNWFMYTTWADIADGGADLIAGQHHNIGTVTGTRNGTTTLNFTLTDGWELAGVTNNVKIHPFACPSNPSTFKYVQPGQFSSKTTVSSTQTSFSVTGLTNTTCYGIHLDVGRWVPDPTF
ncbi:hypothetical protein [Egicoccus sp. AB-alg6-2]|uniref:hypothetical protein n=1 Tax=Egicoccus sp. AB-alg6-2 TaxID=3242692 RepID=UPI00359E38CC